jgi:preprotein translocase subunit YajC
MLSVLFAAYGPQGGAGGQGQGGGNPMSLIFMIIAIFAVMYFLMIRPQQRLHGTVAGVKDNSVIIKIADNVKVEVSRSAISQIVSSKSSKTQTQTQTPTARTTQTKKNEDKDEESSS